MNASAPLMAPTQKEELRSFKGLGLPQNPYLGFKYSLSNAPADTKRERLAQMQGARYWVERAFEDAKGECGLADYQAVGWRAWHHHVSMVMLAMLFIAEQRVAHQPGLALLTPRDIVEMLKETLPAAGQGGP